MYPCVRLPVWRVHASELLVLNLVADLVPLIKLKYISISFTVSFLDLHRQRSSTIASWGTPMLSNSRSVAALASNLSPQLHEFASHNSKIHSWFRIISCKNYAISCTSFTKKLNWKLFHPAGSVSDFRPHLHCDGVCDWWQPFPLRSEAGQGVQMGVIFIALFLHACS
jgi:hypothetical protein